MHESIKNLLSIEKEINQNIKEFDKELSIPEVIAVSKTFKINDIIPLINHGHIHFGENKVQEALEKWLDIKNDFKKIKLHLMGKLQTNKVKNTIPLFDYIHSLDNLKLAEKISTEQIKKNFKPKVFIQVNIGSELQKNGIDIDRLDNFYDICKNKLGLDIIGLMCLPPNMQNVEKYFSKMLELKKKFNLNDLSMGMSNDYMQAVKYKATFLRIGSKIFGSRD